MTRSTSLFLNARNRNSDEQNAVQNARLYTFTNRYDGDTYAILGARTYHKGICGIGHSSQVRYIPQLFYDGILIGNVSYLDVSEYSCRKADRSDMRK